MSILDRMEELEEKAIKRYLNFVSISEIVEMLDNDDYMEYITLNAIESLKNRNKPFTDEDVVDMIGMMTRYNADSTYKLVWQLMEDYGVNEE